MSEQRFDIAVQDKVAPSIKTELTAIGNSARAAYKQIRLLNGELGRNAVSSASTAQASALKTVAATAKLNAEQAKAAVSTASVAAAQDKASIAANKLAQAQTAAQLAQQKLATEAAKTAAAQSTANIAYLKEEEALNRAIAAEKRAVASKEELAAASTRTAKAQAVGQDGLPVGPGIRPINIATAPAPIVAGTSTVGNLAATEAATKKATQQITDDVLLLETKTRPSFARFKVAASDAFGSIKDFVTGNGTRFRAAANEVTAGATLASGSMSNLGNKAIFSATAVRELLVVAREGSRGDLTRMAGSLSILAVATGTLGFALPVAVGGFAALFLAHKAFNDDITKSQLKDYANTLGLSSKEMRKLSNTTMDAKGSLHELNLEQITYEDTFRGLITTVEDGFTKWQREAKATADTIGSAFQTVFHGILTAYNYVAAGIIGLWNTVRAQMNGANADPGKLMNENVHKAYVDILASEKEFGDKWKDNTVKAAKERMDAEAAAIKAARNAHKAPKGWNRDQNLQNDNAELDAQITLLGKYGDELERANQLEQISKKYRDHNVALTTTETAALAAKIKVMQDGKRVQEAMTAADEAINGPARKYDDTLTALNTMLEKGKISQADFTAQMFLATRAFEDATDPLAALNRQLELSGELMGKYGKDKDVATYIQQLQQAAQAQGKSIYEPGSAANDNGDIVVNGSRKLTSQAQGMVGQFKQQQQRSDYTQYFSGHDQKQKAQDPNSDTYVLNHYKELYAEIQKLRDANVDSEAASAEKLKALNQDYLDARLASTQDVLNKLTVLSESKSRAVAAIGKAAAIAEATIDGIRAVQKALASPPGPPATIPLAVATGVMAAVNVAKIAGIGFQKGGYTGDGPVGQRAGDVHGQEFVFDAPATKRIGVPALEAARRGTGTTTSAPANNNHPQTNITIRPEPGVYVEERRTSAGEIEMIARRIVAAESGDAVAHEIQRNPNSKASLAISRNYGVNRSR